MLRIYNGKILTRKGLRRGEVWCRDGKIVSPGILPELSIDARGAIVAPGYIDMQINGGYGVDFTAHPEKVGDVARKLPSHGVTSFLPTIISTQRREYRRLINLLQPRPVLGGASLIGIHLEGPFFNPQHSGAHAKESLAQLDEHTDIRSFYGVLSGVKLVTLAPELPYMLDAISQLGAKKIAVAIGHSAASLPLIKEAIQCGAKMITHLYNGMPPFHHRRPSLIDAALVECKMAYSLICDGIHVDSQAIKLAWKMNPAGIILISDAMEALGLSSGIYQLAERQVEVRNNRACLAGTETLAGSTQGMDEAVRHLHTTTGCSLSEALEAASHKPAVLLGMSETKGTLKPGADADFIFLDESLHVLETYVQGHRVF